MTSCTTAGAAYVLTPEQLVIEQKLAGERVVVYDTDGYYMGATMAETLAADGHRVTYITHFDAIAPYMRFTLEEQRQYQRLIELGVEIVTQHLVTTVAPGEARLLHVWSGAERALPMDSIMLVTQRNAECDLFDELKADPGRMEDAGIKAVHAIGDAWAPGMVAQAIFSGHRLAREIDSPDPTVPLPFIRERRVINSTEADYMLDSAAIKVPEHLAHR